MATTREHRAEVVRAVREGYARTRSLAARAGVTQADEDAAGPPAVVFATEVKGINTPGDLLEALRIPSLSEREAEALLQAAASMSSAATGIVGYALVHGAGHTGTAQERCAWLESALNSALCEEPE